MSRKVIHKEHQGKPIAIIYGLDRLMGYFLEVVDHTDVDEGPIINVATYHYLPDSSMSKGDMVEEWQRWGIPASDIQRLALDLDLD